jgi:hypothetical protein
LPIAIGASTASLKERRFPQHALAMAGFKNHRSRHVTYASIGAGQNAKAHPAGGPRAAAQLLSSLCLRYMCFRMGDQQILQLTFHKRRVARTHQLFGRFGTLIAAVQGATAGAISTAPTGAGALIGRHRKSFAIGHH